MLRRNLSSDKEDIRRCYKNILYPFRNLIHTDCQSLGLDQPDRYLVLCLRGLVVSFQPVNENRRALARPAPIKLLVKSFYK